MVLTAAARASYSRGFIYNLVTSDADNVQMMCNQIFTLISSPIRIVVAMALLYGQLGIAAFAALGLLICVIPIQVRQFQHHDCSSIVAIAVAMIGCKQDWAAFSGLLANRVLRHGCTADFIDVRSRASNCGADEDHALGVPDPQPRHGAGRRAHQARVGPRHGRRGGQNAGLGGVLHAAHHADPRA